MLSMNWGRFVLFLIVNFGALALGGLFTGSGVASDWYQNMDKKGLGLRLDPLMDQMMME